MANPNVNEELHKLEAYEGLVCNRCGRSYPDIILNIEAVIHHDAKHYECINRKSCKRKKRFSKKRSS